MSYYQRSIQNAIQKIKINEVLIIKSQRQSKCEETSLMARSCGRRNHLNTHVHVNYA